MLIIISVGALNMSNLIIENTIIIGKLMQRQIQ